MIYKVTWLDIQAHTSEKLTKPYKDYLCESYTIGEIVREKDTVIVIYGGNSNGDKCFDAIPKECVKKIEKIKGGEITTKTI